jgi:hypothetical protein
MPATSNAIPVVSSTTPRSLPRTERRERMKPGSKRRFKSRSSSFDMGRVMRRDAASRAEKDFRATAAMA